MDRVQSFRRDLLDAGLLRATTVDGLYQRSATFERIVRGMEAMASAAGAGAYEPLLYFPPLMPRETFVKTDYLRSFPDLIGSVDVFTGGDREHARLLELADGDEDWSQALSPAEVTLCSAACHPLYPSLSGRLPAEGRRLEVQGFCFRHEPSLEPTRMQSFRQHEFVYAGTPDAAVAHRDDWLETGLGLLASLGLPVEKVVANDPFFGRAGKMLATNQRDIELKFEIVCPVISEEAPTAIASANYHLDHFGLPFAIETSDGSVAHTACIGFGLERITLALLATHGLDVDAWPESVRHRLWP
ncbi:MAG: amino acid--[acyl-carrier-protein] ligase [Nocardioidaceae bacterium]